MSFSSPHKPPQFEGTIMRETTEQDILWEDSLRYFNELLEEKKDIKDVIQELVHSHRVLRQMEATSHLEDE